MRLQDTFECNGVSHSFEVEIRMFTNVLVPSRLLTWISTSIVRIEGLSNKSLTDRKLACNVRFNSQFIFILTDDRETEISVLETQLSHSLSVMQGFSLNHKPSKHFLGRKYALEVSPQYTGSVHREFDGHWT